MLLKHVKQTIDLLFEQCLSLSGASVWELFAWNITASAAGKWAIFFLFLMYIFGDTVWI